MFVCFLVGVVVDVKDKFRRNILSKIVVKIFYFYRNILFILILNKVYIYNVFMKISEVLGIFMYFNEVIIIFVIL